MEDLKYFLTAEILNKLLSENKYICLRSRIDPEQIFFIKKQHSLSFWEANESECIYKEDLFGYELMN